MHQIFILLQITVDVTPDQDYALTSQLCTAVHGADGMYLLPICMFDIYNIQYINFNIQK